MPHERPQLWRPDKPLNSVLSTQDGLGGASRSEIYRLIKRGELESVKIGRSRMVVTASVLAYVEKLRGAEEAGAASPAA